MSMDPLSITASIIAVLQASGTVLSICYDYRSAIQKSPWGLAKAIEEVRDLRNVLESLESLSVRLHGEDSSSENRLSSLRLLCSKENGPLQGCLLELNKLERKLNWPTWSSQLGKKRRALIQAIGWQVKDADVRQSLQNLDRYKSTLNLAITADETALLLDIRELQGSISSNVIGLQEDISSFRRDFEVARLDDRHRKLLRWLSPIVPESSHEVALQTHQNGTSDWIIQSEEVLDWLNTKGRFIWLNGFPGAGKTVLFSMIVRWMQLSSAELLHGGLVAYYYCDFRKPESQETTSVIGSLVAQICTQMGLFPDSLEMAYDQSYNSTGQPTKPAVETLQSALQSLAKQNQLFLLVDALDESSNPEEILKTFKELTSPECDINIFVTSRDEQRIRQVIAGARTISLSSHLFQVSEDIRSYINYRLENDIRFQWLSKAVKADIQESLSQRSGGMFRWVQCQLDQIAILKTVRSIRKALNELPQDLEHTYERILLKISPHYVEHVQKILKWLAFAYGSLTLRELHDAITIDPDLDYLDEEARLSSPEDILDLCNSLVSLTENGVVRLAHLSVKDYLLSSGIQDSPVRQFALDVAPSYLELCACSLAYLSVQDFAGGPSPSDPSFQIRRSQFPLLDHAAIYWPYYSRTAGEPDELHNRINKFFDAANTHQFMSWIQVLNALPTPGMGVKRSWDSYPRHATPLYYAASFGLLRTVRFLVQQQVELDAPGSRFGGTALHAAVLRQHMEVARFLLEAGVDPNRADFNKVTPLHTAVLQDNIEMIELLLRYGADSQATDVWGHRAERYSSDPRTQEVLEGLTPDERRDLPPASEEIELHRRRPETIPTFIVEVSLQNRKRRLSST